MLNSYGMSARCASEYNALSLQACASPETPLRSAKGGFGATPPISDQGSKGKGIVSALFAQSIPASARMTRVLQETQYLKNDSPKSPFSRLIDQHSRRWVEDRVNGEELAWGVGRVVRRVADGWFAEKNIAGG